MNVVPEKIAAIIKELMRLQSARQRQIMLFRCADVLFNAVFLPQTHSFCNWSFAVLGFYWGFGIAVSVLVQKPLSEMR